MPHGVLVTQRNLLHKATALENEQRVLGKSADHEHSKKILKLASALRMVANAMNVAGYEALYIGTSVEHDTSDRKAEPLKK